MQLPVSGRRSTPPEDDDGEGQLVHLRAWAQSLASEQEHCCVRHLPRVPQVFSCVSSRDVPAPHSLVARGGRSYYTGLAAFRPRPPKAPRARGPRPSGEMPHSHITASHTPRTRLSAPLNVQLIGFGERAAASARVRRAVESRATGGRARVHAPPRGGAHGARHFVHCSFAYRSTTTAVKSRAACPRPRHRAGGFVLFAGVPRVPRTMATQMT